MMAELIDNMNFIWLEQLGNSVPKNALSRTRWEADGLVNGEGLQRRCAYVFHGSTVGIRSSSILGSFRLE